MSCQNEQMFRTGLIALLLFASPVAAPAAGGAAMQPQAACLAAGGAAERTWMLPPDLIRAIGRVESGRYDRDIGHVSAWPWTVNANGSGYWFASLAEAVAFVRTLQSHGVRLIDVGCFQVDLFYHPAAFSSLERAFDPVANADYAARFLTELHQRTGSWAAAIAGYHSGVAVEGENYRQKVMRQWDTSGVSIVAGLPVTETERRQRALDRYAVLMSASARAIRIIGP